MSNESFSTLVSDVFNSFDFEYRLVFNQRNNKNYKYFLDFTGKKDRQLEDPDHPHSVNIAFVDALLSTLLNLNSASESRFQQKKIFADSFNKIFKDGSFNMNSVRKCDLNELLIRPYCNATSITNGYWQNRKLFKTRGNLLYNLLDCVVDGVKYSYTPSNMPINMKQFDDLIVFIDKETLIPKLIYNCFMKLINTKHPIWFESRNFAYCSGDRDKRLVTTEEVRKRINQEVNWEELEMFEDTIDIDEYRQEFLMKYDRMFEILTQHKY